MMNDARFGLLLSEYYTERVGVEERKGGFGVRPFAPVNAAFFRYVCSDCIGVLAGTYEVGTDLSSSAIASETEIDTESETFD
jgi:hypothetical protein